MTGFESVIRLMSLPDFQPVADLETNQIGGSIDFSSDGRTLIYWHRAGRSLTWTGKPDDRAEPSEYQLPGLALDFNPRTGVFAMTRHLGVTLWDSRTGLEVGGPLAGHFGTVSDVDFSSDGRHLASSAGGQAVVWDLATRQAIGQCAAGSLLQHAAVALSPDGRRVALTGSGNATVDLCVAPGH